jgi:hypothetical protein
MAKRPYHSLAEGACWAPSRRGGASGLIFIPPLIGDTALGQLHRFRVLRRAGFAIYTFAFPGHPGAGGRFSLQAAIQATRRHLQRAAGLADQLGAPLFGLGCCVAAIPLLAAIQAATAAPQRLLLLNPIVRFAPATLLAAFWRYSRQHSRNPLHQARILSAYLEQLFPGVATNRDRFGALERRRVALFHLLAEIAQDRFLDNVRLEHTLVVCCYGKADDLLRLLVPQGADSYEAALRRHCPRILFEPLPASHFLRGAQLRSHLLRLTRTIFTPHGRQKKGAGAPVIPARTTPKRITVMI